MGFAMKRVYEPAEASDDYRVLVDRLWLRGVHNANNQPGEIRGQLK